MPARKVFFTVFLIGLLVFAGVLAGSATRRQERNLKVLPKDISDQKLDSIMHSYNTALGVECKFCHAPLLVYPGGIDYASDKEPMKENARDMIRMMIEINKNHFWFDKNKQPEYLNTVACITCHRGEELPPENH